MKNKIGIVLPFQNGDLITGTSVLKYRDVLWPDCDIVWFCNEPHSDALKFQDIETRYFPHGWGILANDIAGIYSERVKKDKEEGRPEWEDWSILMNSENRLKQELKNKFSSFSDLSDAYFPAPWMLSVQQRHGLSYPDCSKKVFGVPMDWEWHPVIAWSEEEREAIERFLNPLAYRKLIYFETFAGSDQSKITQENVEVAVRMCRQMWPNCGIIFSSHKFLRAQENFPDGWFDDENILHAKDFTVRQCGLLNNYVDLIISVSSGTTVACSAWNNKPTPILQLCGSFICSTKNLALDRHFELVTTDHKTYEQWSNEFYSTLSDVLNIYK